MKTILSIALLLSPLSLGAATMSPEAVRGDSGAAFSALAEFHAKMPVAKIVPVSGNVNMNGSGNLPPGAMQTWVNLSGYADVRDAGGRISSGSTWFNANVSCTVSGGWINCNDYPAWSVDFYRDGKWLGRGTVRGSINAQVYAPNGFFTVNAYTYLSGDVSVAE